MHPAVAFDRDAQRRHHLSGPELLEQRRQHVGDDPLLFV